MSTYSEIGSKKTGAVDKDLQSYFLFEPELEQKIGRSTDSDLLLRLVEERINGEFRFYGFTLYVSILAAFVHFGCSLYYGIFKELNVIELPCVVLGDLLLIVAAFIALNAKKERSFEKQGRALFCWMLEMLFAVILFLSLLLRMRRHSKNVDQFAIGETGLKEIVLGGIYIVPVLILNILIPICLTCYGRILKKLLLDRAGYCERR